MLLGLHHVTATVADALEDVDFCTVTLGLRLVKKTVNFDNHGVYHFYYGSEDGAPGTLWTTFPYGGQGVAAGTHGAGQVTLTSFSVPADSLEAWRGRLAAHRIEAGPVRERFGQPTTSLVDPSGLALELVADERDERPAWVAGGAPEELAIRGLHGVALSVRESAPTVAFLTDVLGFEILAEEGPRIRLGVGGDGPGHLVDVIQIPDGPRAVNGLGTVHHVAFAIADAEEQLRLRAELVDRGLQVTEVRDRQYFRSIYFREPGGVLYEVATLPPGFTIDEELANLGRDLKLPPWEEPHRAVIEAELPPVVAPDFD